MASTYPLELVQLQQWLHMKGQYMNEKAKVEAVQKEDWDPSIQAMVLLPEVVKRLSENIKWTADLGNAFLAQQSDVMDAVQRMRTKAKDAGKLESNEQMKVETQQVESKTVVVIEQASPEVVYVPSYNPAIIWGTVGYYPYPPIYYAPYAGLYAFGVGIAIGAAWGGGWGWGAGWGNNDININRNNNFNRNTNINRVEIGSIPSIPVTTGGSTIHNIAVARRTQIGTSPIGLAARLAGIRFPTVKRMRVRILAGRPAPWTAAVSAVATAAAGRRQPAVWVAIAAAWAGTALAAETFRGVPVNGATVPLGVAGPGEAAAPGPVAHEVLPVWERRRRLWRRLRWCVVAAAVECAAAADEAAAGGGSRR